MPRRPRQPDPQQRLPFEAAEAAWKERFALLEAITPERAGLTAQQWGRVKALLATLHRWSRETTEREDQSLARPRRKRLAAELLCSEDTIDRTAKLAKQIGVLVVAPRFNEWQAQTSNDWTIDWPAVASLGVGSPDPKVAAGGPQVAAGGPQNAAPLTHVINSTLIPPPPPPTPSRRECPLPEEWGEVEEKLRQCQVNQAASAVREAWQRGVAPHEVLAIAEHWARRARAWQHPEAVLYRRVQRQVPQLPAAWGWPDYDSASATLARQADEECRLRHAAAARQLLATLDAAEREAWIARARSLEPRLTAARGERLAMAVAELLATHSTHQEVFR